MLENSDLKKEVTILEKTIITERTIKYIKELNGFGDTLDIVSSNIKGRHRPSDICKLFGFSNNRELYPSLRKYGFISPNEPTHTSRIPTELAFELNLVKYKNNYSPPMFTDMGLATMFVIFYNNGILDPYYLNIFKTILKLREYDLELIKQNVRKLNEIKVKNNFSLN